jgi:hypothetical protein
MKIKLYFAYVKNKYLVDQKLCQITVIATNEINILGYRLIQSDSKLLYSTEGGHRGDRLEKKM